MESSTSLILILMTISVGSSLLRPSVSNERVLWRQNDNGVPSYRIPILSHTPKGNLIILVEGRRTGSVDIGPKYIMLKRSEDKGDTWSNATIIFRDDTSDGANLGTIVVDDTNSVIYLFMVRCAHKYLCSTPETLLMSSQDDGITWSGPVSLNQFLGTKMFCPGPGTGLQKKHEPHKGRLLTCGHSDIPGDGMFTVVSDDSGSTWRYAGAIKSIPYNQPKAWGDFTPDECQPFEMPDGSIVVNIRNQYHYHCHCRIVARSYDGGETFQMEDIYFDSELIDPAVCAGANIQNGILYFANPFDIKYRRNLQLTWSVNNGSSWERDRLVIWNRMAGYSVLEVSPHDPDNIYLAVERGVQSELEQIVFHRIRTT